MVGGNTDELETFRRSFKTGPLKYRCTCNAKIVGDTSGSRAISNMDSGLGYQM